MLQFDWSGIRLPKEGDIITCIDPIYGIIERGKNYQVTVLPKHKDDWIRLHDVSVSIYIRRFKPLNLREGDKVICVSSPPGTYVNKCGVSVGDVYTVKSFVASNAYFHTEENKPKEKYPCSIETSYFDHLCLHLDLIGIGNKGWPHPSSNQDLLINQSNTNHNGTNTDNPTSSSIKVQGQNLALAGTEGYPGKPVQIRRGKLCLGRQNPGY